MHGSLKAFQLFPYYKEPFIPWCFFNAYPLTLRISSSSHCLNGKCLGEPGCLPSLGSFLRAFPFNQALPPPSMVSKTVARWEVMSSRTSGTTSSQVPRPTIKWSNAGWIKKKETHLPSLPRLPKLCLKRLVKMGLRVHRASVCWFNGWVQHLSHPVPFSTPCPTSGAAGASWYSSGTSPWAGCARASRAARSPTPRRPVVRNNCYDLPNWYMNGI